MRIGIAMSGGVDSTVSALLLRDSHEVEGFFMRLAQPKIVEMEEKVRSIAHRLGIPLHVIDLQEQFQNCVLDYFSVSYFKGLTPNPCIVCNQHIKFGLFLDAILARGMHAMATGHYVRLISDGRKKRLLKGLDSHKDQSYFLSRLSQRQLTACLFPLGGKDKKDTYLIAESHGFLEFHGTESQDVCFLQQESVADFLQTFSPSTLRSGPILTTDGRELGRHQGIFRFTIGQRKGLGISADAPLYVVAFDTERNAVIVGKNDELLANRVMVKDLHWLQESAPDCTKEYTVRIRYTHAGSPAKLYLTGDGHGEIIFVVPQRAITPGQFAVVYEGDEVLGSGVIVKGFLEK